MRIAVFDVEDFETEELELMRERYDLSLFEGTLNTELINGFDGVSVLPYSKIDRSVLDTLKSKGINHISTRTIGYDHIDVNYAKTINVHVYNAYYSPYNVADYTVMLMLMCIRKMKRSILQSRKGNYTLDGLRGRQMKNLCVGIIGTGKIGATVIEDLSGFGCRILAYDNYQKEELKKYCEYVSLKELFEQSDLISLHVPYSEQNHHLIDEDTINLCKEGVIFINTARGELIDSKALLKGLESGKIAAAGLDTIEDEVRIVRQNKELNDDSILKQLISRDDVIYSPHVAFFTEEATASMVESGISSLQRGFEGEILINEITK